MILRAQLFISVLGCTLLALSVIPAASQPLSEPYTFSFPPLIEMDTAAFQRNVVPAGSLGRVELDSSGHFRLGDGSRFRIAGVTLMQATAFPDSATATAIARRLRTFGINCVRFTGIDYPYARTISILADGASTLGAGLDTDQMKRFDWFVSELRQNGIYFTLEFHNYWSPRPEDRVRQWDSTGWGARMPLLFDQGIQKIHRGIIEMVLRHVNPYTGLAYKDDPALVYLTVTEDASLIAYWTYTHDIVRPNMYGAPYSGDVYIHLIDSLYQSALKGKGLTTDAALNAAWSVAPRSPNNQLSNPGFEDPFSTSWVFTVDQTNGAQAVLQTSETDKKEGSVSARIRIGKIDANASSFAINLVQLLPSIKHLHRYRLSFWAKTSTEQQQRQIGALIFNGTFPYQSYGLQQALDLTAEWKYLELDFTAQVTDTATAALVLLLGNSLGDVYLDDIQFREIGFPGLKAGESITKGTVKRHELLDASISPARAKSEAEFYRSALTGLYDRVFKLVRDTLRSEVLLCPSNRMISAFEFQSASQYDVFTSSERRTDARSMLDDIYGGNVSGHANSRMAGKAFVMGSASIDFPRQYQPEMGVIYPAYAGLQDWDGVFFGIWDLQARVGNVRTDSAATFELFDKPHVLALMPGITAAIRQNDIAPSSRVVEITNNSEALDHPRLHALNPYSLSLYTDPRMPIFRRVHTRMDVADEESFLPHLEVSQIANDVDPSALDAENEQIFWDATKGLFRVSTPRFVAVTGNTSGQIVNLPSVIIENNTANERATITLASLTPSPLTESTTSLLTISSRALNEGASWNAENTELTQWGAGAMQMQGIDARITISAPTFDTLFVTPLDNEGRRRDQGQRIVVPRGMNGRFSIAINTAQYATPWYLLDFVQVASSVVDTHHEISFDGPHEVTVTDIAGRVVLQATGEGQTSLDLRSLTTGVYVVRVAAGGEFRTNKIIKY